MKRAAWAACAALVLFHLYALDRYPPLSSDESVTAEAAHWMAREGQARNPSIGATNGIDQRSVVFGHLHLLAVGVPDRIAGPSLRMIRLQALVAGVAVVLGMAMIGRVMNQERAGWMAAAFFALSSDFYLYAHEARPEMLLMSLATWSLYFIARAVASGTTGPLTWAGVLIGFGFEIHLNTLIFIVPLSLMSMWYFRLRSIRFFIATVPGILLWLFLHVLVDPGLFVEQWGQYWMPTNSRPIFPFASLRERVYEANLAFADYFWVGAWHYKIPLALMILTALVWTAMHRREPLDRLVLWFTLPALAVFILFIFPKVYYVALFIPIAMLSVARALLALALVLPGKRIPWANVLTSAVIAYLGSATAVVHIKYERLDHHQGRYFDYVRRIRNVIPPEATVLGNPALAYMMPDRRYRSSGYLFLSRLSEDGRRRYGKTVREVLERAGIEFILLDTVVEGDIRMWEPDEWEAILSEWEDVHVIVDDHYGGRYGGPEAGRPRITRIMRRRGSK